MRQEQQAEIERLDEVIATREQEEMAAEADVSAAIQKQKIARVRYRDAQIEKINYLNSIQK